MTCLYDLELARLCRLDPGAGEGGDLVWVLVAVVGVLHAEGRQRQEDPREDHDEDTADVPDGDAAGVIVIIDTVLENNGMLNIFLLIL